MVTFDQYLETCRFEDSPEADFVKKARTDGGISKAKSWEELRDQVTDGSVADPVELEAARSVWQAYVQAQGHPA